MRTVFGSTAARIARAIFTCLMSIVLILAFQVATVDDASAKKRKYYKKAKVTKSYKKSRSYRKTRKYNRSARRARAKKRSHIARAAGPNPRYAAYVVDAKTGKVLYESNGDAPRFPASLTKMMTVYLIFEDLKSGRLKKTDRIVMSRAGARREPSKIGLRPGQSLTVEQAILSLVTKSANDVATAVGDQLSGSEAKFAQRMTRKARQLGMNNTTFKNANGLTAKGQVTTAADMAKLGLALREHFPREYRYFETRVFKFGKRRYGNHNKLLGRVRGVDGIKTGYTRASGFNLVSSVSDRNRRIVAVVMGGRSGASRNAHMTSLISKYLPKASTGGQQQVIARATGSAETTRVAAISTELATKASNSISLRIDEANQAPIRISAAEVRTVQNKIIALAASNRPTPQLRRSIDAAPKKEKVDKTLTASVEPKPGYQIQIAASDDRSKAVEMLKEAKARNRDLLAATSLFTQEVVKNGATLYRARFVGFDSKRSATRACQVLKRQRYACLALDG